MLSVHLLAFVYATGFLTAGNWAGHACNTFPKVGEDWFIKRKHLMKDVKWYQNLTENKLVIQVVHRTLACGVIGLFMYQGFMLSRLNLIP